MADTNTPNILLLLPDLGDTFNFGAHVEANFSTIDSLMGMVQCTSTTRPSNTYAGQGIYETDSKRYAQNTGTKASPVWTYMSHAALAVTSSTHPTSGRSIGELIYETDTTYLQAWNGSAFEQKAYSNLVTTSSAHPSSANSFTGLEIYETDTGLTAVYSGSNFEYSLQQIAPTQKLTGTTASVTFSGIPAVRRLILKWLVRGTSGTGQDLGMRVDGATTNYQSAKIQGRSGAVSVVAASGGTYTPIGITTSTTTANYFSSGTTELQAWSNTSAFLTYSSVAATFDSAGASSYWTELYNGQYLVVGPHTSITVLPGSGSFAAGSEFSLYAAP